jgi:hypothetical protein
MKQENEVVRYVNDSVVSEITGIAVGSLRNMRMRREGIPYSKIKKSVLYSLNDVYKFMESRKVELSD